MPQRELFDADTMLRIAPEDMKEMLTTFKATGRQQGDAITDQIMAKANHLIRAKLRAMNVNIEAEAAKEGMDVDDYVEELNTFYSVVYDITHAYLEGMETALPFPIFD